MLFDLGGVLIENAGFDELRALLPYEIDQTTLKAKWLSSPAVRAFELGRLTPEVFASRFVQEWELDLSAVSFIDAFTTWPKGFFPGAEALLRRLRATYRVACLSNSNALHWQRIAPLLAHFDAVYSSHLLGKIKPEPDVFLAVVQDLGAKPDDVYFFDDSAPNVVAAQALGMHAFHVEGVPEIERHLGREHLL